MYICVYTYMYVYICTCVYTYVCTCVCVCVCIVICPSCLIALHGLVPVYLSIFISLNSLPKSLVSNHMVSFLFLQSSKFFLSKGLSISFSSV